MRQARAPDDQCPGQAQPGGERKHEVERRRQRAEPLHHLDRDQRAEQPHEHCVHNIPDARVFRPSVWARYGSLDPQSADYRACAAYGALYK